MTENDPVSVPRTTLTPPRKPPIWSRGATTFASGTWATIAFQSSLVNWISRPAWSPAYGLLVRIPQQKKLLVAAPAKPALTPLARPLPAPRRRTRRKMPQKTPKAVRNVRSRFLDSAAQISCQVSSSNRDMDIVIRLAALRSV